MTRRVVVTGMGALCPLGHNVQSSWQQIKAGRSGIGPITFFPCDDLPVRIAGEIRDFDFGSRFDKRELRRTARFTQLFMASSAEAIEDANFAQQSSYDVNRVGVILGNGVGGFEILEQAASELISKGYPGVQPLAIPRLISNEGAGNVAMNFGFHGPCYSVVTACASGTDAIGAAFHAIRNQQMEAVLVGGSEAAITRLGVACFAKLTALASKFNDNPQAASRPFDKNRCGFVIGEGSGSLILEELESAKKRGAKIYAEIMGYGATCDAFHLTAPDESGVHAANAMRFALEDARLSPDKIGYINAHGTSTILNDRSESLAIKQVFGDNAYRLKISSLKSMTGHMLGGAGAVELIATICSLRDQFVHPTINYEEPDPDCDLDYVPNKGQPLNFDYAISNSLGFGGHNASLVVKRYQGD